MTEQSAERAVVLTNDEIDTLSAYVQPSPGLILGLERIIADRLAPVLAAHNRTHWCITDDQQPEVYAADPPSPWPCPTLRDLASPPASPTTTEEADRG